MRAASPEDEEVSFHPRYEGESSNNDTVYEEQSSAVGSSMSQGSGSGDAQHVAVRVQGLESDMGSLKAQVKGMDSKLDLLLSTTGFGTPAAASTPPRPNGGARGGRQQQPTVEDDIRLPPPRQLRRAINEGGYVDDMLRKERFIPLPTEGKNHLATDIFSDSIMPKPYYMYAAREGVTTLKQKLDIRPSLSYQEYINASINLIMDPRACQVQERKYILEHICDVTHDALECPWEGVRRWSCICMG